jgi:hypothetical protein
VLVAIAAGFISQALLGRARVRKQEAAAPAGAPS